METEIKGTLLERLDQVEERVLKVFASKNVCAHLIINWPVLEIIIGVRNVLYQLCLQLEGELEAVKEREEKIEKRVDKKGLKGLVKKVVKGRKKS